MASKKTGRLAGLAALAGAAYLADKKGMFGGKGEATGPTSTTSDREDAEMGAAMRTNAAPTPEEGESAQSKFRKAELEAGDVAAMAPRTVAPRAVAPRATAPAGAMRSIRSDASPAGMSTAGGARSGSRGGAEAGEEAAYKAEKTAQALKDFSAKRPGIMARMREKDREMFKNIKPPVETEREPLPTLDTAETNYKRGGKVKKMASGGMTSSVSSASRRADGIATKGKTRGKMY